jgi:hypothetical protein
MRHRFLLLTALLFTPEAFAQAPLSFQPATPISLRTGVSLQDLTIADFNHDGRLDFAVVEADTVAILHQRPGKVFVSRPDTGYAVAYARWVLALPLDQLSSAMPAVDDLFINGFSTLTTLLNRQGRLALSNTYQNVTGYAIRPTTGAYDLTPGPDLAYFSTQPTSSGIASYANPGTGALTLQPVVLTFSSPMQAATTADLNGDGLQEALVVTGAAAAANTTLRVHPNVAAQPGSIQWWSNSAVSLETAGGPAVGIAAGDVDGDGLVDVAIAHAGTTSSGTVYRDITLLLLTSHSATGGGGPFRFAPTRLVYPLLSAPRHLALADLNGDARPELLVTCADGTLNLFENTGGASQALFTAVPYVYPAGLNPTALQVADLDTDGDLDVMVSSSGDDTIYPYYNMHRSGLSTHPVHNASSLAVTPNPATATLQLTGLALSGGATSAELLDLTGRVVRRWGVEVGLVVADLARGVYVVRLHSRTGVVCRRVVLQ